MEFFFSMSGILAALFIGVISPGPSFVLVAQTAMSASRRNGVAAALGMGVGAVFFASLVLVGLHTVLLRAPVLFTVLKVLGGAYLIYLAIRIWRGATASLQLDEVAGRREKSWTKSFLTALGTMLSNPKAMVQYGAIFAALLPHDVSPSQSILLAAFIFLLEAGWYTTVAVVLSSPLPRNTYLKAKTGIDRCTGLVMGALGVKLLAALR